MPLRFYNLMGNHTGQLSCYGLNFGFPYRIYSGMYSCIKSLVLQKNTAAEINLSCEELSILTRDALLKINFIQGVSLTRRAGFCCSKNFEQFIYLCILEGYES